MSTVSICHPFDLLSVSVVRVLLPLQERTLVAQGVKLDRIDPSAGADLYMCTRRTVDLWTNFSEASPPLQRAV